MEIKFHVLLVARFVAWTCALEVLWLVFVGTTQSTEVVAGAVASVIVALFVEALRRVGVLGFRGSPGAVARAWTIPGHLLFDFGLVFWTLARELAHGRRVRGEWVSVPFDDEPGPRGRFLRALTAALENETPNAIVVDLAGGKALLHSLDARVSTGRQVM